MLELMINGMKRRDGRSIPQSNRGLGGRSIDLQAIDPKP